MPGTRSTTAANRRSTGCSALASPSKRRGSSAAKASTSITLLGGRCRGRTLPVGGSDPSGLRLAWRATAGEEGHGRAARGSCESVGDSRASQRRRAGGRHRRVEPARLCVCHRALPVAWSGRLRRTGIAARTGTDRQRAGDRAPAPGRPRDGRGPWPVCRLGAHLGGARTDVHGARVAHGAVRDRLPGAVGAGPGAEAGGHAVAGHGDRRAARCPARGPAVRRAGGELPAALRAAPRRCRRRGAARLVGLGGDRSGRRGHGALRGGCGEDHDGRRRPAPHSCRPGRRAATARAAAGRSRVGHCGDPASHQPRRGAGAALPARRGGRRRSLLITTGLTLAIGAVVVLGALLFAGPLLELTVGTAYARGAELAPQFAVLGVLAALLQLLLFAGLARRTRRAEAFVWSGITVQVVLVAGWFHGSAEQVLATSIAVCAALVAVIVADELRPGAAAWRAAAGTRQ